MMSEAGDAAGPCGAAEERLADLFLRVIGLVVAVGFGREAWQCAGLCRETRAVAQRGDVADMIRGGLAVHGVAAELRAARARPREPFNGFSRTTQLTRAAHQGDAARVRLLLALGAAPDARDAGGRTALYWAASNGNEAIMRELLAAGASAGALDRSGWAPLLKAAGMGHAGAVRLLLAAGADASHALPADTIAGTFFRGFTALDLAKRGGHAAVVEVLELAARAPAAPRAASSAKPPAGTASLAVRAPPATAPVPALVAAARALAAAAQVLDVRVARGALI